MTIGAEISNIKNSKCPAIQASTLPTHHTKEVGPYRYISCTRQVPFILVLPSFAHFLLVSAEDDAVMGWNM